MTHREVWTSLETRQEDIPNPISSHLGGLSFIWCGGAALDRSSVVSDKKLAFKAQLFLRGRQQPWNAIASDTHNKIVAITLTMKKWHEGDTRLLQSLKSAQHCDSEVYIVLCLLIVCVIETCRDLNQNLTSHIPRLTQWTNETVDSQKPEKHGMRFRSSHCSTFGGSSWLAGCMTNRQDDSRCDW